MSCGAGNSYCLKGGIYIHRIKFELFLTFVVNQIAIIIIQFSNVLPCTSLRFVLRTSSHLISSNGCALVSWQGIIALCSIVSHTDAISLRPTLSVWIQWHHVTAWTVLALLACFLPLLSSCPCMWRCSVCATC